MRGEEREIEKESKGKRVKSEIVSKKDFEGDFAKSKCPQTNKILYLPTRIFTSNFRFLVVPPSTLLR